MKKRIFYIFLLVIIILSTISNANNSKDYVEEKIYIELNKIDFSNVFIRDNLSRDKIETIEFVKQSDLNPKYLNDNDEDDISLVQNGTIKLKAVDSDNNELKEIAIYSEFSILANENSNKLMRWWSKLLTKNQWTK